MLRVESAFFYTFFSLHACCSQPPSRPPSHPPSGPHSNAAPTPGHRVKPFLSCRAPPAPHQCIPYGQGGRGRSWHQDVTVKSRPLQSPRRLLVERGLLTSRGDNSVIFFRNRSVSFCSLLFPTHAQPFPSPSFKQTAGPVLPPRRDGVVGKGRQQSGAIAPGSHQCRFS